MAERFLKMNVHIKYTNFNHVIKETFQSPTALILTFDCFGFNKSKDLFYIVSCVRYEPKNVFPLFFCVFVCSLVSSFFFFFGKSNDSNWTFGTYSHMSFEHISIYIYKYKSTSQILSLITQKCVTKKEMFGITCLFRWFALYHQQLTVLLSYTSRQQPLHNSYQFFLCCKFLFLHFLHPPKLDE